MPSEVQLDTGIAKFKVDLTEFVSSIKDLVSAAVGANEREQARDAIKAMIAEVRQTYDTVVDTLSPLYAIGNPQEFTNGFNQILASFKKIYLQRSESARAHCHNVRQIFGALEQRRSWMIRLPIANRGYARLKNICEQWLFNDIDLSYQMSRFFENLNEFLDQVGDLNQTDAAAAYQKMRGGLRQAEPNFREIQSQLGELDAIGRNI